MNFWTRSGILNHCGNWASQVWKYICKYATLYSSQYVISRGSEKTYSNLMIWTWESSSENNPFLSQKIGKSEKVLVEYISSKYFDKHCYITKVKKMYRSESNNYKTWHFWNYLTTYKQLFYECQHRILWKVKVHLHFFFLF